MFNHVVNLNLFYPFAFLTIIVLIITMGIVKVKAKDNGLFINIFNRHSCEHEDTTEKMECMHNKIVEVPFTTSHEIEMHAMEYGIRQLNQNARELNEKVDLLLHRVNIIERNRNQNINN